ncbi:hypothetical protein, partial [Pseudomonas syringae group genomosp. 7]|uniref:hypothetical protein n=1 Tax=Pseudomonas syringae group genomosp. 7 TaxID=251699 RepID=UPI00376F6E44
TLKYNILMYFVICGTTICGILSASIPDEYASVIQVILTTGTFSMGLASAIIKFSKFEQKALSHKNIAAKFASLEANIRRQLSLDRNE